MTDIVQLNVGGHQYITTRSTLTQVPDSLLSSMFAESPSLPLDKDGSYFIDRNGPMFQYVLDFLRCSQLALPKDFPNIDQLQLEAEYYQLQPMLEAIDSYRDSKPKAGFIQVSTHIISNDTEIDIDVSGDDKSIADLCGAVANVADVKWLVRAQNVGCTGEYFCLFSINYNITFNSNCNTDRIYLKFLMSIKFLNSVRYKQF